MIICYYNEAESALLRSVWSVLDRSPPALLREVLLVDDASTNDVTSTVERHVRQHGLEKVSVICGHLDLPGEMVLGDLFHELVKAFADDLVAEGVVKSIITMVTRIPRFCGVE